MTRKTFVIHQSKKDYEAEKDAKNGVWLFLMASHSALFSIVFGLLFSFSFALVIFALFLTANIIYDFTKKTEIKRKLSFFFATSSVISGIGLMIVSLIKHSSDASFRRDDWLPILLVISIVLIIISIFYFKKFFSLNIAKPRNNYKYHRGYEKHNESRKQHHTGKKNNKIPYIVIFLLVIALIATNTNIFENLHYSLFIREHKYTCIWTEFCNDKCAEVNMDAYWSYLDAETKNCRCGCISTDKDIDKQLEFEYNYITRKWNK